MNNSNRKGEKENALDNGFIALTSLLIISAIALAIAVSISLLGIGETKSSLDYKKGREVYYIARGCLDESLLQLKSDETYPGETFPFGNGACNIVVSGTSGSYTIDIEATLPGNPQYLKRLQAQVMKSGNSINLISMEQIP